jgi:low affinity Fe/Cu permease
VKAAFHRFAARAPSLVGSPWTFFGALAATALWISLGPAFGWSGGWVLWPATVTSVGALLLVILLQYTQNRDTRAVQLKLDELIRSLDRARTDLVRLERLTDDEISEIEEEFEELRSEQTRQLTRTADDPPRASRSFPP